MCAGFDLTEAAVILFCLFLVEFACFVLFCMCIQYLQAVSMSADSVQTVCRQRVQTACVASCCIELPVTVFHRLL